MYELDPNAPKTPAEREAAAKARQEADGQMPDARVSLLAQIAGNPKKGDPFVICGKVFNLAFVTIEVEQALISAMIRVYRENSEGDMADALINALPELTELAALILSDPIYMNQPHDTVLHWLRTRVGDEAPKTHELLELVLKTAAMQEVGQLLGKLLTPAGLAGALINLTTNPHGLAVQPS